MCLFWNIVLNLSYLIVFLWMLCNCATHLEILWCFDSFLCIQVVNHLGCSVGKVKCFPALNIWCPVDMVRMDDWGVLSLSNRLRYCKESTICIVGLHAQTDPSILAMWKNFCMLQKRFTEMCLWGHLGQRNRLQIHAAAHFTPTTVTLKKTVES